MVCRMTMLRDVALAELFVLSSCNWRGGRGAGAGVGVRVGGEVGGEGGGEDGRGWCW